MSEKETFPNKLTWLTALYLEQWNILPDYSHIDCKHELAKLLKLFVEDQISCYIDNPNQSSFPLDFLSYAINEIDFLAIAELEIYSRS